MIQTVQSFLLADYTKIFDEPVQASFASIHPGYPACVFAIRTDCPAFHRASLPEDLYHIFDCSRNLHPAFKCQHLPLFELTPEIAKKDHILDGALYGNGVS